MGMTIDETIPILHDMYNYYNDVDVDAYVGFDNEDNNAIETALETMHKYQMMQADYENRLNADLVAMLTELKAEIGKMSDTFVEGRTVTITSWKGMQKRICNLIQSKIDKLKEKK